MNIFRKYNALGADGYVSLLLVILIIPLSILTAKVLTFVDLWEPVWGTLFVALATYSFSIGFAISGLRQHDRGGRLTAMVTLVLAGLCFLVAMMPAMIR